MLNLKVLTNSVLYILSAESAAMWPPSLCVSLLVLCSVSAYSKSGKPISHGVCCPIQSSHVNIISRGKGWAYLTSGESAVISNLMIQ